MTDQHCGNCRFGVTDPQDLTVMYCYRYPPTVQVVGQSQHGVMKATSYPPVDRVNGWCGEFCARPVTLMGVNRINGENGGTAKP